MKQAIVFLLINFKILGKIKNIDNIINFKIKLYWKKTFWYNSRDRRIKSIGIITAWLPELNYLHEEYPSRNVREFSTWEFRYHSINNLELVSVISDVGKQTFLVVHNYLY